MKKSAKRFAPYANEADVLHLGGLTLENRLDRISLHGDLDLTRDKPGLASAKALQAVLAEIIQILESEDLPDHLPPPKVDSVPNPFS